MRRPRFNLLIRTTLMGWVIAIVSLLIYAATLYPQLRKDFLENLGSKANGVTVSLHDLAASALISEDYSAVVDHCTEMLRGDSSLEYIVLTRHDGFSLVHDRNGWRTDTLAGSWHPSPRTLRQEIGTFPPMSKEVFRFSRPFEYSGIEWGWVHIGVSLSSYNASLSRLYHRTLILGAAAIFLALGASYLYARWLLAPILHLQSVVGRVANGELTARAASDRADELGALARSINTMTEAILLRDRTLHEANILLEQRVEDRTHELRTQMEARDRAHQELAEAQRRLLEASRLAGMAEVATGVLHNVGNVLNSVNISANLLREQLSHNPNIALLQQTADLMRAQGSGLTDFLSNDPRGRLVPALVMELADQLTASCTDINREFTHLSQNIDHIKQIVAVQQDYAKAGGVTQTFDPAELFADALRITQSSMTRHGIAVKTDYPSERPQLVTDRHLALQIVVNLLSNAVQAVKVRSDGQRQIVLHLRVQDGFVHLTVEDNGIGIDSENRQKLFQHGFTTRKDGHGFGLHSGALAAQKLGGTLQVESDGLDRGARFTLALPLTTAALVSIY